MTNNVLGQGLYRDVDTEVERLAKDTGRPRIIHYRFYVVCPRKGNDRGRIRDFECQRARRLQKNCGGALGHEHFDLTQISRVKALGFNSHAL